MIGDLATEDGRVAFSSVVLVDRVDGGLESRDRRGVGERRSLGCRMATRRIRTCSRVANRDWGHRWIDHASVPLGRRAIKKRCPDRSRRYSAVGRGMKLLRWSARRISDGHVANCDPAQQVGQISMEKQSPASRRTLCRMISRHGTTRQLGTNPLTCAMPSLSFFQPPLLPRP